MAVAPEGSLSTRLVSPRTGGFQDRDPLLFPPFDAGAVSLSVAKTATATSLPSASQQSIQVERTPNGYRVSYQDPDFDNAWRQYDLPAADQLQGSIATEIDSYSPGLWRYAYTLQNAADSAQHLVSLSFQTAYGTDILASPFGWDHREDAASFITSMTRDNGIIPGGRLTGWSLVSDNLPVVRQARLRGSSLVDLATADLPKAVRQRIEELERQNTRVTNVIAPGLSTRIIARGHERIRTPLEVWEDALSRYSKWLRDAAREAEDTAWVDQVIDRMNGTSAILAGDRRVAERHLRDSLRVLARDKREDPWLESLRRALIVVTEYVASTLR